MVRSDSSCRSGTIYSAYDDAELLLTIFGAGELNDGWGDRSFQQLLLACEDEMLIELSSHITGGILDPENSIAPAADRPLLVFGSHLVAYKGILAAVEAALKTFGVDLEGDRRARKFQNPGYEQFTAADWSAILVRADFCCSNAKPIPTTCRWIMSYGFPRAVPTA